VGAVATEVLKPADVGDAWRTPPVVLERVREFAELAGYHVDVGSCYGVALDPCSGPGSIVSARTEIALPADGLAADWYGIAGDGLVFVNPPYSKPGKWVAKCEEVGRQTDVIALVTAAPDTAWWRWADAVCFWRGRIKFIGPDGIARFPARTPSAVLYWGDVPELFEHAFRTVGKVVRP